MCPQSEQTSSLKKEKKGMALKHGISGSNRFVIKKLEEQLRSKQQRCEEAERVNRELRAKEQVWPLLRSALHNISIL
jgi:predicted RNase H-like nuclease (RuvC/YqgF family)